MTEQDIKDRLKNLPDVPVGLIKFRKSGDFHGLIEWEVERGNMLSYRAVDHPNGEAYHTRFAPHTEVSWHDHNESCEFMLCLEGELNIVFEDGSQVTLNPTEDIKIQKGVKHMAVIGNKPCQIVAITIPKENG